MNVDEYLERIEYQGMREPSAETLRQLHLAHMYGVPFENLDITLGQSIELSLPLLYEKIIMRQRGGFCYELNALFGWLLEQLGFKVELLSARVFDGKQFGPEFDHMLLLIDVGEQLIADVGFGDSFVEPILLDFKEHTQHGCSYCLKESGASLILCRRLKDADWESQYMFSLQPRQLDEFNQMCHYQQTSPDSSFTQKSVCSLATSSGRITLSNGRLIVTNEGNRKEWNVTIEEQCRVLLRSHFGIDLGEEAQVNRLLYSSYQSNKKHVCNDGSS